MKKDEFLTELRIHLHGLSQFEIDNIIEDYERFFHVKEKEGVEEELILEQLDSPRNIAEKIKEDRLGPGASNRDTGRKIIVGLALVFFNLVFVLGPLLGLVGLFLGLFVGAISLILSPLGVVVKFVIGNGYLFEFYLSLAFAGVGLLLLPLLVKGAALFSKGLEKYTDWNMKLIRGEGS